MKGSPVIHCCQTDYMDGYPVDLITVPLLRMRGSSSCYSFQTVRNHFPMQVVVDQFPDDGSDGDNIEGGGERRQQDGR